MKINAEESGTFIKFPAFPCAKKKKKNAGRKHNGTK